MNLDEYQEAIKEGGVSPTLQADVAPGPNASDATDQSGGGDQKKGPPKSVSYGRFKEVNDEKKALQEEIRTKEASWQDRVQQLEKTLTETTQSIIQNQNAQATPAGPDPLEGARKKFGDDDAGEKAYEAVVETVKGVLEEAGLSGQPVNKDEILQDVRNTVAQHLSGFSNTVKTTGRIQNWYQNGLIGEDDVQKISTEMQGRIAKDKRWEQGDNLRHLANDIFMEMLESGAIKPSAKPSGGGSTPLRAGPSNSRGGGVKSQEDKDRALKDIASRFPSLNVLNTEQLRELGGDQVAGGADGGIQYDADGNPMPTELISGTYTLTPGGDS